MNKKAIKEFAVWARNKLISDITYKAGLIGISAEGISEPLSISTGNMQFFDIGTGTPTEISGAEISKRDALVREIRKKEEGSDYKTAFDYVIEEVAYTWFNRLIAIRFMEVNDYLPSGVRVLSSETPGKSEPDFVTAPFETDLDFSEDERKTVIQMKTENRLDELFRMLFIKQCNKLHEVLPALFEKIDDYTEFLLNISFTEQDGIVARLVGDIEEADFDIEKEGQIQIIGWLYQYYNIEPKDEVFALLKKNVKITKERIPAATQLFTPHWIVQYMVENSLGRLWIEGHPNDEMKKSWKYYLDEAEQEESVQAQLAQIRKEYENIKPEEIKLMDPSMGSGHILVYAFDILMQIYESCGYTQRDAARSIIENNLYGLDIDKRAYQLAYFAVMMKGRQYSRRILREGLKPKLFAIEDSSAMSAEIIDYIADGSEKIRKDLNSISSDLKDARELGSIIPVMAVDFDSLYARFEELKDEIHFFATIAVEQLLPLVQQAEAMAQKYDVAVTNPPYMGLSGGNVKLNDYVKKHYADSKSDLFAVFMERCSQMTDEHRFCAMITQHSWMFLSSFEKLRQKLLQTDTINMVHLGARAFEEIAGEVVQTTSFVMRKTHVGGYKGTYCRLIEPTTQQGKEDMFLAGENRYEADQSNFEKVPGSPVAYWVGEKTINIFLNRKIECFGNVKQGMIPGNVDAFLRIWHEVSLHKVGFNHHEYKDILEYGYKWFPYNKGGSYRRWYGNIEHLINMENNGYDIKFSGKNNNYRLREPDLYFQEAITWSKITSGSFSARYMSKGHLFDIAGCCIFDVNDNMKYIMAVLNSVIGTMVLDLISPTLNYEVDHLKKVPIIEVYNKKTIEEFVDFNISMSKRDWDSYETSWDFKRHPLI